MESIEELISLRRTALQRAVERQKERGLSLDQWTAKAGLSRSTVRQYLAGQSKSLNCETYDRLAVAAGVSIMELLELEHASPLTVPVVGHLGVGAEVGGYTDMISTGKEQHVDALPRIDFPQAAIIVAGEYCSPRFNHGDIIYYRNTPSPPIDLLGRECVIQLDDGRIFIKTLLQGRVKDRYSLVDSTHPVITDVALEWAKPITWVAHKAAQTSEQMRPFGQYTAIIRRNKIDHDGGEAARARILEELDTLREMLLSPLSDIHSAE